MAPSDALGEFVTAAKTKGLDDASIVALLKQNGWSERRIYAALSSYHEAEIGIPIPLRGGRTENARDAFFYLLAFVTLGIWSVALVWLADAIVDRMLPSALKGLQDSSYFREEIAGQLASLIIAFPIFLFVSSRIVRDARLRPESLESGVRKWLTYIALVIAAITLVGDGVWFLRTFLVGDLTLRFVFKALALAIIAGGIFSYYLSTMRADGTHSHDRSFGIAATVAVVACLILGFLGIGSPYYERQLAFDLRRENDLRDLRYQVQDYWTKHKTLPPKLTHPIDQETNKPYEYLKGKGPHYQLCATFDTPSSTSDDAAGNWTHHASGTQCFSLDATVTT